MSFSSTARLAARPRSFTNPNQVRHRLSSGSLSTRAPTDKGPSATPLGKTKETKLHRYSLLSRTSGASTPALDRSACMSPLRQALNASPRLPSPALLQVHMNDRRVHSSSACFPPSSLSQPLVDDVAKPKDEPMSATSGTRVALPPLKTDFEKLAPLDLVMPPLTSGSTAPITSFPPTPTSTHYMSSPFFSTPPSSPYAINASSVHQPAPSPTPPESPPPPESPLAHARRAAPPPPHAPLLFSTTRSALRVHIPLPHPNGDARFRFAPEMVTVSAKRGNRLDVVADAWHLERDCHFEWHVVLPAHGVDMRAVRARFDDAGDLDICVPRRTWEGGMSGV